MSSYLVETRSTAFQEAYNMGLQKAAQKWELIILVMVFTYLGEIFFKKSTEYIGSEEALNVQEWMLDAMQGVRFILIGYMALLVFGISKISL